MGQLSVMRQETLILRANFYSQGRNVSLDTPPRLTLRPNLAGTPRTPRCRTMMRMGAAVIMLRHASAGLALSFDLYVLDINLKLLNK